MASAKVGSPPDPAVRTGRPDIGFAPITDVPVIFVEPLRFDL